MLHQHNRVAVYTQLYRVLTRPESVMQNPILTSTALLTLLLSVGLFFFIRASAKDRTEVAQLVTDQQEEPLFEQLQQYFARRAYRIAAVDANQNQVKFEGFVRPSAFLAVFLTLLAAIGIFCLSLVLAFLFPSAAQVFPVLVGLAPVAGWFYWTKAGRQEQVLLQVASLSQSADQPNPSQAAKSLLTVTAHRDEVIAMKRELGLRELNAD